MSHAEVIARDNEAAQIWYVWQSYVAGAQARLARRR